MDVTAQGYFGTGTFRHGGHFGTWMFRHLGRFRHTYVTAFRHRDMIAYERSMGFRHSYNDLEALNLLRRTKLDETI